MESYISNIWAAQVRHGLRKIKIKNKPQSWGGRERDRCEYDKNTLYVIIKELTQILKGSSAAFQ